MGWSSDHPRNLRYLGEISREIFLSKFEWHKKWPFPVLVTKHKGYFRHETQTSHTRSGHFSTELKCFYQQHSATMRSHNLRCGSEILAALLYRWIAGTQKRSKKYDHVLSCTIYIYLSYLTFDMERRMALDIWCPCASVDDLNNKKSLVFFHQWSHGHLASGNKGHRYSTQGTVGCNIKNQRS